MVTALVLTGVVVLLTGVFWINAWRDNSARRDYWNQQRDYWNNENGED